MRFRERIGKVTGSVGSVRIPLKKRVGAADADLRRLSLGYRFDDDRNDYFYSALRVLEGVNAGQDEAGGDPKSSGPSKRPETDAKPFDRRVSGYISPPRKRRGTKLSEEREGMFKKQDWLFAFGLLAPSIILLVGIRIYPVIFGVQLAFTNASITGINSGYDYVGFKNFLKVFKDGDFWGAFWFTIVYVVCVVFFSYAFGLFCGVLLNGNIKARSVWRALLLVPWVIPGVVAVNAWTFAFNPQLGFINNILYRKLHLVPEAIQFFGTKPAARATVILTSVWKSYPFMMVMMLAGLQGIPDDLYEAARIDGAGTWAQFRNVTMPMLSSVTMVSTTLMCIWNMNSFEGIWLLTRGGPNGATYVMAVFTYFAAFYEMKLGYASAMSTVSMLIMMVFSIFYIKRFQTI